MQFNSIAFAAFFPIVFIVYWLIQRLSFRWQNAALLIASSVFLGRWDYRFLLIIYSAATIDYFIGLMLANENRSARRHLLLYASLIVNLGLLGFFKYFNFFITSFADLMSLFGIGTDAHTLNIILPVGISFYTFQRLTYIFDLYRRQMPATRDLIAFLSFSIFFPVVLAGPIERAQRLLPQFLKVRTFDITKFKDALRQILWGLFKKIVIADNLAPIVNRIFTDYAHLPGIDLAAGVFLFAVQIYCDFSGYSDMAMGIGRLLGFRILRNFAYPYFSRDIAEFWRRWHISMSSWFRDYVYTPLTYKHSMNDRWRRFASTMITFSVSGLWHGANWTFVIWGALNGLYFFPLIFGNPPQHETKNVAGDRFLPSFRELGQVLLTFALTLVAWVFFRADTVGHAFDYLGHMVASSYLILPRDLLPIVYSFALLLAEWFRRDRVHLLDIAHWPIAMRWGTYMTLIIAMLLFGSFGANEFFYAQF